MILMLNSGGTYGDLVVYYATSMIDLVTLAQEMIPVGSNYLWFYHAPFTASLNATGFKLDKSSQPNPLQVGQLHYRVAK